MAAKSDPVRTALATREHSSRTFDQRVYLRWPRLIAEAVRVIAKLPPRSRVRRALLARATRLALEAYNRRDLEAVVIGWDPEFEYRPDRDWVEAGLVESVYRGLESYRRYVATADEVWGEENYVKPAQLIDLGDRLVILADMSMRAQVSGVPLAKAYALVTTLEGGRIARHQEYFDHARALADVGLGGE